jgi:DNA topoisomerase-3
VVVVPEKTKPPLHYTEATLLTAMETAGRAISEEDLREAMSERGLGTPATRASIIEALLNYEYLERKKKELWATEKGVALISRLKRLTLDGLCSPQLTGEWEYKLRQMEQGQVQRNGFMRDIMGNVVMMVAKVKNAVPKATPVAGFLCPKCKKTLVSLGNNSFSCPDKHVSFNRMVAKRLLSDDEIKTLLELGSVGPLNNFISKVGKPFPAKLVFNDKGSISFDFGPTEKPSETVEHDGWSIGITTTDYVAQKAAKKVFVHRKLCQRVISLDEAKTLLSTGKVGPLDGFISKAGKPFRAFLAVKNGKVEFEFEDRR